MPNMLSMDLTNFDPSHVESMFDKQTVPSSTLGNSNIIDGTSGTMDVEDDVASWLDSLCSQNNQHSVPMVPNGTGISTNGTTGSSTTTAWTVKSELNGNNGDLMPRGDPLMGSFSNSIANNEFDL